MENRCIIKPSIDSVAVYREPFYWLKASPCRTNSSPDNNGRPDLGTNWMRQFVTDHHPVDRLAGVSGPAAVVSEPEVAANRFSLNEHVKDSRLALGRQPKQQAESIGQDRCRLSGFRHRAGIGIDDQGGRLAFGAAKGRGDSLSAARDQEGNRIARLPIGPRDHGANQRERDRVFAAASLASPTFFHGSGSQKTSAEVNVRDDRS